MHLNYNHFLLFTLLLITIFMLITVPFPVESTDLGKPFRKGWKKTAHFFENLG
ncbi:unnamed protein product [Meloidogyne enterolobii]|uniref:Uncharacterized protein n=1 Tax=Meloidogyne enterolobii TaxID=390850 RepID=A0ACB1ARQ8_MELEN